MPSEQIHIVMPAHVNGNGRLFGGQLMAWIDVVAAVEARRFSHRQVTTVSADHLTFLEAVRIDEMVRLEARVTWTGRTSLEVRVDSFVESLDGEARLVNRAYLVFVAIDGEGSPVAVTTPFVPADEEEKREWAAAEKRREQRLRFR